MIISRVFCRCLYVLYACSRVFWCSHGFVGCIIVILWFFARAFSMNSSRGARSMFSEDIIVWYVFSGRLYVVFIRNV